MTEEEIARDGVWLAHYRAHLNTLDLDTRHAVLTAERWLGVLEMQPERVDAARGLATSMDTLRAALARRPVLPPLPEFLSTGEFVPLEVLARYGITAPRRVSMPRVRNRFDPITGRKG